MNLKIQCLRDKLKAQNMQGMIVSNPVNVKYLTGLDDEGTLLITLKENVFLTDGRYIENVQKKLTIADEIIAYDIGKLSKYDYENFFIMLENIGFEEKYVTYETYKNYLTRYQVNLVETEGIIEKLRTIKEQEEIESISKACKITDDCFKYIQTWIKRGMTEKEIAFEMECYMRTHGADGLAFDTIVASGHNSSLPHAVPTDRRIREGDIILFDFGCRVNGYCSDMSRTIFVSFVDEEYKKDYDFVLGVQEKMIEEIRDGANIKLVVKNAENEFKMNNYEIMHSFGHGVGLDIHEIPYITSKFDNKYKENNIVTVEPGIYIPGRYGIRIEDTVLVKKDKAERLTLSSKDYIIIKG